VQAKNLGFAIQASALGKQSSKDLIEPIMANAGRPRAHGSGEHGAWKRMNALIDIGGQRFGRLAVVKRVRVKDKSSEGAMWLCRCDCGARSIVRGYELRSGRTISCGCHGRQTGLVNITHGDLRHYKMTAEYVAWRAMLARCNNPGSYGFRWYGAKGIAICKEWRTNFSAFLADMGRKPEAHFVLGRLDKEGDYEPNNCVWMDKKTARWPGKSRRAHVAATGSSQRSRVRRPK
jgi:hypothetical protein